MHNKAMHRKSKPPLRSGLASCDGGRYEAKPNMEVTINNKDYLDDFIRLNEEWTEKYFVLEEADKNLAKAPEKIIDNGGFIFTLTIENKAIGVCALFNEGSGVYELARMAVSPQHHGNGYSNKLLTACFKKLTEVNAQKVYLVSNTKLEPAINLYKKHGFKTISEGQHPIYARANIVMECPLAS